MPPHLVGTGIPTQAEGDRAEAQAALGLWFVPEVFGRMGEAAHREEFLKLIDRCAKQHGMTMYRQDGGGTPGGEGPDRIGVPKKQHVAGLYELQDQIRRRFPGMLMEGCRGGRRIDLDRGFALVFKRNAAGGDTFRFAPRALDPKSRYALQFEAAGSQAIHSGEELAKGIVMTLKPAPDADLVRYEKLP